MKNTLMLILTCLFIAAGIIINTLFIISLKNQLSDCRFECNHLQTKLHRLEELSDVIEAMNQVLPPLALARLKVIDKMIKDKRYKAYEKYEQPLLTEKEKINDNTM